jgi:hypothetical protein
MHSFEGPGNVTFVSAEEFSKGHRTHLAKVTRLPTSLLEPIPPMSGLLELFVETNVVAAIIEQLQLSDRHDEVTEIKIAIADLRVRGYSHAAIRDFVIDYTESIDENLSDMALTALAIQEARKQTVDIETFIPARQRV